jgi:hypothetical protein
MLFMGAGDHTEAQIAERKAQFDKCYSTLSALQQGAHSVSQDGAEQWEQELRENISAFLKSFAGDFDLLIDWQERAELIED